ncbi:MULTISPECIES: hypothetical protein [Rhizobiaceae]|uniref:hypothetical protein n=1 Tax=Rhizobiaceae TaxID=82115 RepID=UPI002412D1D6|nr:MULTISPECIES: hypothetical protein [Rhizobiaceae]MDG3580282.1 hypothetical protein [Rhizobium sp. YJ-22]
MSTLNSRTALVLIALAGLASAPGPASADESAPASVSQQAQDDPRGIHRAIGWAETELAEMDATITALEADSARLQGEAKARADAEMEKLRATRDSYRETLAADVARARERTGDDVKRLNDDLAGDWTAFETQAADYLSSVSAGFEARKAAFEARAQAQRAAFAARIEELNRSAANTTDETRAAIDRRVAALNDDLRASRERLAKLGEASDAAWTQFVDGLREARAAFRKTYESN